MKTLYFTNRDDWRAWLSDHARTENEIWLIYYKKNTRKPTLPYEDSVEEAICFGWIDSIIKKIDEETYARKFTPRTDSTKWSELNKKRARKVIESGKMTEQGAKVLCCDVEKHETGTARTGAKEKISLPPHIERRMRLHDTVWANFNGLPPSQRNLYIRWIMSAKKEETQIKRLGEAINLLAENKKLGMK
jgi:uncharacterized protein YdeI (YjbR/CyaY-like superfamily)